MKAVILRFKLLQPLLVTRPGAGEENSSEAYSFVPGAVLRGALIGLYLEGHPGEDISHPTDKKERPFFDGSCNFLNGYPIAHSGERMLPTPLSWRVNKNIESDQKPTVCDFAVERPEELETPAGLSQEFAWISGSMVELAQPNRFMQVHNASQQRGTKKAGDSFVYRYETLAEGQVFEAAVAGEGSHSLCRDLDIIPGLELRLGGSRSANYGRVIVTTANYVNEWPEALSSTNAQGNVILTLLSDAILTGNNGQPAASPDEILNAKHIQAFARTRVVGGFNRKWGLPLPQAFALQAGSVFVYSAEAISAQQIEQIQAVGIGERRQEGFGRVAFNWLGKPFYNPFLPKTGVEPAPKPDEKPAPALTRSVSKVLAGKMAERKMRTILERRLAVVLSQLKIENPPQPSQLARLRSAARLAQQLKNLELIRAHVDSLKSAADQLERARVTDNESTEKPVRLNEWLREHIVPGTQDQTNAWTVWSKYLQPEAVQVAGEGITPETMSLLQIEYTARLLDALFRRTVRTIQSEQGKNGGEDGRSMG